MTVFVKTHQPCPCGKHQGCFSVAEGERWGKCHSCGENKTLEGGSMSMPEDDFPAPAASPGAHREVPEDYRGISRIVRDRYGCYAMVEGDEIERIIYPYVGGATKIRGVKNKEFHSNGPIRKAGLYGKDKFAPGSNKSITITEGEEDAMAAYQMLGLKIPVVSVQSSSSAVYDCTVDREYLNSFEQINICFDADGPGQKAAEAVAKLFEYNKVHFVKLTEGKDANEYLSEKKERQFVAAWYNARKYTPAGLLGSFVEIRDVIRNRLSGLGLSMPMPTLNEMLGGLRLGKIYLFTAETGVGKTEVTHWLESHILKTTDDNMGVIHIEEATEETIARLAGYQEGRRMHMPGDASEEEITAAYEALVKRTDRLWIYTQYGSDDPSLVVDKIRYMVTVLGCKFIVLDHISKTVSGLGREEDRRVAIEWICDALDSMRVELGFCLILVSHVNKEGGTFNSGAPSKVAETWVHLRRNLMAESEFTRRVIHLEVLKNRPGSVTGPGGELIFDMNTWTLSELSENEDLPV